MENLKKKIILITGSSRGLGFELAKLFLDENFDIIINSNNKKNLIKASKKLNNCYYIKADLRKENEVKKTFLKIKKKFKKIDFLICNFGNSNFKKNNLDLRNAFNNNFFSSTNTVKYSIPILKKNISHIVCISSVCSMELVDGAPLGYSLAKLALNAYVKGISRELINKGIKINTIAPGNILFKGSVWEKKLKRNKPKIMRYIKSNVPLKKFAIPDDIFKLCIYLFNSKFITGSTYLLDGGQCKQF